MRTGLRLGGLVCALALALGACDDSRPVVEVTGGGPARSTAPVPPATSPHEQARQVVDDWDEEHLAGGVLVVSYDGTDPAAAAAPITGLHAAGVIVMGYNVESTSQVEGTTRAVQEAARKDGRDHPPVIAVDQEGGTVTRLGGIVPELPAFMSTGAAIRGAQERGEPAQGEAAVTDASLAVAAQLRALGFTWVFAPSADVTIGPTDPTIGSRSASDDPDLAAAAVTAAVTGFNQGHIVSVAKHYPGHGSVTTDSHVGLPVQDAGLEELRGRDFVPFRAAEQAGVPVMMMSHIAYTRFDKGVPSTLSPKAYTSLREETGFDGLIVTDAMNMQAVDDRYPAGQAAVTALAAGADLVLMPTDPRAAHAAIVAALKDGSLPRDRVREAAARVVALQQWQAQAPPAPDLPDADTHLEQAARQLSALAVTQVAGSCQAPLTRSVQVTGGTRTQQAAFTAAARDAGLRVGSGPTVTLAGRAGPTGTITVATDTPYVLRGVSGHAYALYGDDEPAFRALIDVLTGEQPALGRLPVEVSGVRPPRC